MSAVLIVGTWFYLKTRVPTVMPGSVRSMVSIVEIAGTGAFKEQVWCQRHST